MTGSQKNVEELLGSSAVTERIRGISRLGEYGTFSDQVEQLAHMSTEDGDSQVRYSALSRMSNLDREALSEEQVQLVLNSVLHALKTDKEPSCRAGAADVISALNLSGGFDEMIEIYRTSTDWVLKFTILAGLGEMGDERAFDVLLNVIETEGNDEVLLLTAAIGSLGELGDKRALPIVEKFVDHADLPLRERAKMAVERLTSK